MVEVKYYKRDTEEKIVAMETKLGCYILCRTNLKTHSIFFYFTVHLIQTLEPNSLLVLFNYWLVNIQDLDYTGFLLSHFPRQLSKFVYSAFTYNIDKMYKTIILVKFMFYLIITRFFLSQSKHK